MPTTFVRPDANDGESKGGDGPNPNRGRSSNSDSNSTRTTSTTNRPRKKASARFNGRTQGPAFGLAQWTRLVDSSTDLARRGGAPLRTNIPWDEIKSHNKPHAGDDAWVVLRGTVYNIGPYLPYHPGGAEILSGLIGRDGTKAFDKHHPWVSIDGLIGTLAIGTAATNTPSSEDGVEVESEDDEDDEDEIKDEHGDRQDS